MCTCLNVVSKKPYKKIGTQKSIFLSLDYTCTVHLMMIIPHIVFTLCNISSGLMVSPAGKSSALEKFPILALFQLLFRS